MFHSWPDKVGDLAGSRRMDHVRDPSSVFIFFRWFPLGSPPAFSRRVRLRGAGARCKLGVGACFALRYVGPLRVWRCLGQVQRSTSSTRTQIHPLPLHLPDPNPSLPPPSPLNDDAVPTHPPRK